MKKSVLLIISMLFFLACETGVRYDDNTSSKALTSKAPQSGMVNRNIEDLLDDREEERQVFDDELHPIIVPPKEPEFVEEDVQTFTNSPKVDGLDVRHIREGIHDDYLRLVFDVYKSSKAAYGVGKYEAKYNARKKYIEVILHDYKDFSAPVPVFPPSSEVEQIHFEQYPKDKGFKLYIQLRKEANVKIFDLKSPARLVFDINAN